MRDKWREGRDEVIIILRMSSNLSLDKFLSPNRLISEMGSYYLICCEEQG